MQFLQLALCRPLGRRHATPGCLWLARCILPFALAFAHVPTEEATRAAPATRPASQPTTRGSPSPVVAAANRHRLGELSRLLDSGVDVNGRGTHGETALYAASRSGYVDAINLLLRYHADPNLAASCGETPLMVAETEEVAEILVAHNAAVDAKDNRNGWTPLFFAIDGGRMGVVRSLLKRGVSVNYVDKNGDTPIGLSRKNGESEIVELLRTHGAKE